MVGKRTWLEKELIKEKMIYKLIQIVVMVPELLVLLWVGQGVIFFYSHWSGLVFFFVFLLLFLTQLLVLFRKFSSSYFWPSVGVFYITLVGMVWMIVSQMGNLVFA